MKSLLIGCGNSRERKVRHDERAEWMGDLVTLDMDPNCGADHVIDMSWQHVHMPFADGEFIELAAYDSLEHWGVQGNWRGWFNEMAEYHRILKPGGVFGILVPVGADALADPGHTRFFAENHFNMLNQQWYADRLAAGMPVTDYRWFWKLNFDVEYMQRHGGHHLAVILRKSA